MIARNVIIVVICHVVFCTCLLSRADAVLNGSRVFKIGLLAPWSIEYEFSGSTSASAVSIAIERVHRDPTLYQNGAISFR